MRTRVSLAGVAVWAALVVPATAATVSFSFTGSGGQGSSGNSLVFTDQNGSGITATVKAFSNTGTSSTLAAAALGQWGSGLGVCNSVEVAGGCGTSSPLWEHTVSNTQSTDMVLIVFSSAINLGNLSLSAYNGADVSYFAGNLTGSVSGKALTNSALNGIGLGNQQTGSGTSIGLSGNNVTALLVGARIGHSNDGFKISALSGTTTGNTGNSVPEPTTYAMMGAALLLIGMAKRKLN